MVLRPFKKTTRGYLGNQNLKRVGEVIDMTPEEQLELVLCSQDYEYFIRNHVTIVHVDHGKMKFDLRTYQAKFLKNIYDHRFNIIKIPRQYGKTEAVAAMLLWYVLFNKDFRIAVLAHKGEQAREILSRIKMAYELLPKYMQQGVKVWNEGNIILENDSKIYTSATTGGGVRGRTYNIVYLDEFAHVEQHEQKKFFTGTYPVISSGKTTKMIITSTPNGLEEFYNIWQKSIKGKNSYIRTEVNWWEMPGREVPGPGEAWKKETIENTDERQFAVEFECSFLGSMSTLIDGNKLGQIQTEDPIKMQDDRKSMYIFEKPIKGKTYVMTVDVAKGVGGDYSAFVILDVSQLPYRVVATFADNEISYLTFPNRIYNYATEYNNAHVLIELNELGQSVSNELRFEYEYENLFPVEKKPKLGQILSSGWGDTNKIEYGVKMDKQVKRIGCLSLKPIVEKDMIVLNDNRIVGELSHFVENKTSWAAEEDHHDDLTMCLVSFGWLTKQDAFKELTGTNVNSQVLKKDMTPKEDEAIVGGWMTDGTEDYEGDGISLNEERFNQAMAATTLEMELDEETLKAAKDIWAAYGV